jgi:hypothetical protein
VLGSVAEAALRGLTVPLLLVRPLAPAPHPDPAAATEPAAAELSA